MDQRCQGRLTPRLEDELELIRSVYLDDEVHIHLSDSLSVEYVQMTVHPATAGDVAQQYVCLQLFITLPPQYPDAAPDVFIKNPRGLSDGELERLKLSIDDLLQEECGNPVLMQLFELTDTNVPHGVCSICLCDFHDESRQFLRTDCYHYFHKECIYQHREHWQKNLECVTDEPEYLKTSQESFLACPECRKEIDLPNEVYVSSCTTEHEDFVYIPDETMIAQQKLWKKRFERQKQKGGIIDLEEESRKYRLPAVVEKLDGAEVTESDSIDGSKPSTSASRNYVTSSRNYVTSELEGERKPESPEAKKSGNHNHRNRKKPTGAYSSHEPRPNSSRRPHSKHVEHYKRYQSNQDTPNGVSSTTERAAEGSSTKHSNITHRNFNRSYQHLHYHGSNSKSRTNKRQTQPNRHAVPSAPQDSQSRYIRSNKETDKNLAAQDLSAIPKELNS